MYLLMDIIHKYLGGKMYNFLALLRAYVPFMIVCVSITVVKLIQSTWNFGHTLEMKNY